MGLAALPFLTDEDVAALMEHGVPRNCGDGEVIVAQGDTHRTLWLIESGFALVQRQVEGVRLVVARLDEGQAFGEMSLLENEPASASVVADGSCRVLGISIDGLNSIAELREGFRERLFRSLCSLLSSRLRRLVDVVEERDKERAQSHRELIGRIAPPDPSSHARLRGEAADLLDRIEEATFQATLGGGIDHVFWPVFDDAAKCIEQHGHHGGVVMHRELYATWMSSQLVASALLRAGGDSPGAPTLKRVHDNAPQGDSPAGVALDAWFLQREPMEGLRWAANQVVERASARTVTLLGSAQGVASAWALENAEHVTVMESHEPSLLALHESRSAQRLLLAGLSIHDVVRGHVHFEPPEAEAVLGIGLLDRLEGDDRPAADQQYCRCDQLRHARAG